MTLIDPEKILRLLRESTGKDNNEIAVRFRPGSLNPGHHSIYASLFYLINAGDNSYRIRIDAALYDTHYNGNPQDYSVGFYTDNTNLKYPEGDPNTEQEVISMLHSNYHDTEKFIKNTIDKMEKGEISIENITKHEVFDDYISEIPDISNIQYNNQYYPECYFTYRNTYNATLKYYRKTALGKEFFTLILFSPDTNQQLQFSHIPTIKDVIDLLKSHYKMIDNDIEQYTPRPGYIMPESILLDIGLLPHNTDGGKSCGEIRLTKDDYGPLIKIDIDTKFDEMTKNPYFNTQINYYSHYNTGLSQVSSLRLGADWTKKFIKNWIMIFQNEYKRQVEDT